MIDSVAGRVGKGLVADVLTLALTLALGLVAAPGFTAQGTRGQHASGPVTGGAHGTNASRQLQMRADPLPPTAAAQPFGYPGVSYNGTRRVITGNRPLPVPAAQQPAAQLSRDAPDPRELSNRSLRADSPPTAQPFGYPPASAGWGIIIAPAPTQSFAGSGTTLPER